MLLTPSGDIAVDLHAIAIPKFNTKLVFFKAEDGAAQSVQKNEKTSEDRPWLKLPLNHHSWGSFLISKFQI